MGIPDKKKTMTQPLVRMEVRVTGDALNVELASELVGLSFLVVGVTYGRLERSLALRGNNKSVNPVNSQFLH